MNDQDRHALTSLVQRMAFWWCTIVGSVACFALLTVTVGVWWGVLGAAVLLIGCYLVGRRFIIAIDE